MPDTKGSALPAANFAEGIELLGVETATTGGAKKSVRASMSAIAAEVAEINGGGGLIAPTLLSANYQMLAADAGIEFVAKAGCSQVVLPDLAGSPSPAAGSLFLLTNVSGQEIQFGRAGAWNIVPGGTSLTIGVLLDGSTKSYYVIRSGSTGGGGVTGPKSISGRLYPLPLDAMPGETATEATPGLQFFWPFVWSRPDALIDQLSVRVLVAGGDARIGICESSSSTGLPVLTDGSPLYRSAATAMSAAGLRSFAAMGSPITLKQGGVYWINWATSNSALRCVPAGPFRGANDINGGQLRDWSRLSMTGLTAALAAQAVTDQNNIYGHVVGGAIADAVNVAGLTGSPNYAGISQIPLVLARVA
jgi:hypothetical protein